MASPERAAPPTPARLAVRVIAVALVAGVVVILAQRGLATWRASTGAGAPPEQDLAMMVLSSLLWSAGIAAQGARWVALMPPSPGMTAARAALATFGANALTVTLPGPTAEAMLATWSDRDGGVTWPTAAAAQLLSRLLGLTLIGVLLLLIGPAAAGFARPAAALAASLGLAAVVAYTRGGGAIRRAFVSAIAWLPPRARALGPRVLGVVDAALAPRAGAGSTWAQAAGWSLVSVSLMGAGGYVSARAVGVDVDPWTYAWMHCAAAIGGLVSLLVPSGIGPLDLLWVAMFKANGLSATDGATAALGWREMQALSLLMSVPALLWLARRSLRAVGD